LFNNSSMATTKHSSVTNLPTVNIKFEKFLAVLFKSKMTLDDIKD